MLYCMLYCIFSYLSFIILHIIFNCCTCINTTCRNQEWIIYCNCLICDFFTQNYKEAAPVDAATLLSIYNRIDSEWCSQSENSICDRNATRYMYMLHVRGDSLFGLCRQLSSLIVHHWIFPNSYCFQLITSCNSVHPQRDNI